MARASIIILKKRTPPKKDQRNKWYVPTLDINDIKSDPVPETTHIKKPEPAIDSQTWEELSSLVGGRSSAAKGREERDLEEECLECGQRNCLIKEEGRFVCTKCGVVHDTIIDQGAEWRYYGMDDSKSSDPTRCGLPSNVLLPESSLGSVIGYSYRDTFEMRRIRRYHTWNAMPYKERSLYNVFDTLTIRAVNNGISPCIVDDAKVMYKVLSEARISRGANRKGLIASCIYQSCKNKKVPRSAKEIAEIFKLDIKNMTRGCKKFLEIWNMTSDSDKPNITLSASRPEDFIQRFCSKLNINIEILQLCQYISNKAVEYSIVAENTPPSIAAGSIYLAACMCNIGISKKEISQACKISEVTISKCYKKLHKYRHHLIPPNTKLSPHF